MSPMSLSISIALSIVLSALMGAESFVQQPIEPRKSGYAYMAPSTQALQADDSQNPAMLWVKDGEEAWRRVEGRSQKSCENCHGDVKNSMRGVAARFPANSPSLGRVINLQQQVNSCRTLQQRAPGFTLESQTLIGLESLISLQSRGTLIKPPAESNLVKARSEGESLFYQRMGQLDLSCHDCHNNLAGRSLAGNLIPQAHPTGYPLYRLEWQSVGGLQRRLRNCMVGVRAEPYVYGSKEMVALEAYLSNRAEGMKWEAPAVRP